MSAEALKPCPFCGTQPIIEQTGFSGRARYIYCNLDDCLRPKAVGENEEAAIRSWNTRAPADGEAHAEIQRLQDAKRRALAIADERAKENVALREALGTALRQWEMYADMDAKHEEDSFNIAGERTAEGDLFRHCTAALSNAPPASEGVREEELLAFIKQLSDALLTVRPLGGSELFVQRFDAHYADPVYCQALILQMRTDLHNAKVANIRAERQPADAPDEGPDPLGGEM